jgi:hypothetical protein
MKINAKVIGHELVKKGDQNLVKIKLKGTGFEPLKIELLVDEGDRVKYPFGCAATVDFSVQQSLLLER